MILTELTIDWRNPSARHALLDCNDMHRNLMRAFDDVPFDQARKVLGVQYRLLPGVNGSVKVLVLSNTRGSWQALEKNGYTWRREQNLDALLDAFIDGRVLSFDLFCVPSKKVKCVGKNSRRVCLVSQEDKMTWLNRKGEMGGFSLLQCWENGTFLASGRKKEKNIRFAYTRMIGNLSITDAAQFRKTYQNGIGPEKAYGMGMLLLGRRML